MEIGELLKQTMQKPVAMRVPKHVMLITQHFAKPTCVCQTLCPTHLSVESLDALTMRKGLEGWMVSPYTSPWWSLTTCARDSPHTSMGDTHLPVRVTRAYYNN
jgi:hypothetical protein